MQVKIMIPWAQWVCFVFDKVEMFSSLKWAPMTCLASNWQFAGLAGEISDFD